MATVASEFKRSAAGRDLARVFVILILGVLATFHACHDRHEFNQLSQAGTRNGGWMAKMVQKNSRSTTTSIPSEMREQFGNDTRRQEGPVFEGVVLPIYYREVPLKYSTALQVLGTLRDQCADESQYLERKNSAATGEQQSLYRLIFIVSALMFLWTLLYLAFKDEEKEHNEGASDGNGHEAGFAHQAYSTLALVYTERSQELTSRVRGSPVNAMSVESNAGQIDFAAQCTNASVAVPYITSTERTATDVPSNGLIACSLCQQCSFQDQTHFENNENIQVKFVCHTCRRLESMEKIFRAQQERQTQSDIRISFLEEQVKELKDQNKMLYSAIETLHGRLTSVESDNLIQWATIQRAAQLIAWDWETRPAAGL